jgi:hypothetical protein
VGRKIPPIELQEQHARCRRFRRSVLDSDCNDPGYARQSAPTVQARGDAEKGVDDRFMGLILPLRLTSFTCRRPASLLIKIDLDKRLSNFGTSPRELTVFPIVKLLKRTIEDERQMNFDALEIALAAAITKLPKPIPVPCLTSKKVFVGIGRGHT